MFAKAVVDLGICVWGLLHEMPYEIAGHKDQISSGEFEVFEWVLIILRHNRSQNNAIIMWLFQF